MGLTLKIAMDWDRANWARITLSLRIVPLSTGTPKTKHPIHPMDLSESSEFGN